MVCVCVCLFSIKSVSGDDGGIATQKELCGLIHADAIFYTLNFLLITFHYFFIFSVDFSACILHRDDDEFQAT